jgi:hypothetical protein
MLAWLQRAGEYSQQSNSRMDESTRFEFKYRITHYQYLKVRNALRPYMEMDSYTRCAAHQRYLVRSLYFDTSNYRAYDQKMNGDCDRAKFRLRSYETELSEKSAIRVELKMRHGNLMNKKSIFVSNEEYSHFMQHRHWKDVEDPVAVEFERQSLIQDLRPVILVEYEREGYQSKLKNDLRITFDHRVHSAHARSLFPPHPFFRMLMPRRVILEIKFKENLPFWVERLVREQGLKIIANSKYTQGLQVARHDLYHPDGVILVR